MDDVPNAFDDIMKGFKTKNAYFVGGAKLKSLTYNKAQMCIGYRATTDECPRVKCYDFQDSWIPTSYKFPTRISAVGFTRRKSMAISCLAGADHCSGNFMSFKRDDWRLPAGYAGDPASMDTYGNAKTGDLVWSCHGHTVLNPNSNHGNHFTGWGITTSFVKNDEIHMYDNTCGNKAKMPTPVKSEEMSYMNLFQIRVNAGQSTMTQE